MLVPDRRPERSLEPSRVRQLVHVSTPAGPAPLDAQPNASVEVEDGELRMRYLRMVETSCVPASGGDCTLRINGVASGDVPLRVAVRVSALGAAAPFRAERVDAMPRTVVRAHDWYEPGAEAASARESSSSGLRSPAVWGALAVTLVALATAIWWLFRGGRRARRDVGG